MPHTFQIEFAHWQISVLKIYPHTRQHSVFFPVKVLASLSEKKSTYLWNRHSMLPCTTHKPLFFISLLTIRNLFSSVTSHSKIIAEFQQQSAAK